MKTIPPRSYNPKSCIACECDALPGKRFCEIHSAKLTLKEKLQVIGRSKANAGK